MAELIWKIGFDEQSAERAGKKAGQTQSKESGKGGSKGGSFAGGFLGSIAGSLLSSVKMLFDPLNAIATLLVASLFPILKPFLILFLKVGMLLVGWLNDALGGLGTTGEGVKVDEDGIVKAGDGLKSALFVLGAIIGAIVAVFAGATVGWVAAIALIGGLILSKVGGFLADTLLGIVSWFDELFGTNFLAPLSVFFDGISNVFNGLWNMLKSLITLDFAGVWEGLKQVLLGLWQVLQGIFGLAWENLKVMLKLFVEFLLPLGKWLWNLLVSSFTKTLSILKDLGKWMWDTLIALFKTSFNALSGIGSWIRDKIKSMMSIFGGGTTKSVNDAIITPTGDIIRTSPSDYLIATKNPGSMGGSSSGSQNINVSINGGLITEDVAKQIGRIIQRQINYGGGF